MAVMALVNGAVPLHAKVVARGHVEGLVGALVIEVARMDVIVVVGVLALVLVENPVQVDVILTAGVRQARRCSLNSY